MNILIIDGRAYPFCRRRDVPSDPAIQKALRNRHGLVLCGCVAENRPRLVPFLHDSGQQLRRANSDEIHGRECEYDLGEVPDPEPTARMFLKPTVRVVENSLRIASARSSSPHRPIPKTLSFPAYASRLFSEINAATWEISQHGNFEFQIPKATDFRRGISSAIASLGFDVIDAAARRGYSFRVGICRHLPAELFETDSSLLLAIILPLEPGSPIRQEWWEVDRELLCRSIAPGRSNFDNFSIPPGPYFAVGAIDPIGKCEFLRLLPAFEQDRVMGPVDAETERLMLRYFIEQRRPAFRVSGVDGIRQLSGLLGIPKAIADALRREPDFICPQRGELTAFVEVTSFTKGGVGKRHTGEVIERIRHYLEIAQGHLEVELWQLADSVPQHTATIRNTEEFARLVDTLRGSGIMI